MRVLQVLLSPRIGGAESVANYLAEVWTARGLHVDTMYLDGAGSSPAQRISNLRRAYRDYSPTVVVSHSALPNIYSRIASLGSGIPIVCVLHSAANDFDDPKIRLAERWLGSRTGAVVAVSPVQVQEYARHFPHRKVELIPNGISDIYSPSAIIPGELRVLSVGRVATQKDPETWLRIAQLATANDAQLTFEWVGPLAESATYSGLVDSYPSGAGSIFFSGPSNVVVDKLRASRVLLHTAHREAHSVALLEAAAAGLPIVCTTEVGAQLPSWIVREEFDAGDASAGYSALRRVLASIDDLEREARRLSRRVQDEFGIASAAGQYVGVFKTLAQA